MGIIFVIGTTAEYLKIRPVLQNLKTNDFKVFSSNQQPEELRGHLAEISADRLVHLRSPLSKPLTSPWQIPGWAFLIFFKLSGHLRGIEKSQILCVHGDTFTTVIAAFVGRLRGLRVAHIEAGLRSGSLLHPFPEEMNRIITTKIARIHFAPDSAAIANLKRAKGLVISTPGNTILDSMSTTLPEPPKAFQFPEKFGLVSLHRSEFVTKRSIFKSTFTAIIEEASRGNNFVIVIDSLTRTALKGANMMRLLEETPRVQIVEKLPYREFQYLLRSCSYLITDSGGQQEEAAALGVSTLVHRRHTERSDGIGGCVTLSDYDCSLLRKFIDDNSYRFNQKLIPVLERPTSPSAVIASALLEESQ